MTDYKDYSYRSSYYDSNAEQGPSANRSDRPENTSDAPYNSNTRQNARLGQAGIPNPNTNTYRTTNPTRSSNSERLPRSSSNSDFQQRRPSARKNTRPSSKSSAEREQNYNPNSNSTRRPSVTRGSYPTQRSNASRTSPTPRPTVNRNSRPTPQQDYSRSLYSSRNIKRNRSLKLPLVIGAIVLVIICTILVCAITQVGPFAPTNTSDSSNNTFTNSSDVLRTTNASKLDGSSETTDSNGIVHGTTSDGINYLVWGRDESGASSDKVSLAAVGDQLGTDNNYPLARQYGARSGQDYDYTPFYQGTQDFIRTFDLRFINQETAMAGGEVSGYPVFNCPDACADAIASVGFNLVNFCSNHIWDEGSEGIERSHQIFDQYPQILVSGSYLSQESRDTVRMIERNGMTFALLSYTCVDNWYNSETAPNTYYLAYADKDVMTEEIQRAQSVADVVIVYMHWGDEYTYELNDQQMEYAQFLADLDVDLVLGSHNHNVQPTKIITGQSGHQTPVVFGLSDYVSGWTLVDTIFSGIFTCDFVREDDGSVSVTNMQWYPTIEWSDGGDVYVRRLCDMTPEEIDANTRIDDVSGSYYEYLVSAINSCGMEIPIVL